MKINNIKKAAKLRLNGNYIRCSSSCLLYFIIISLITFFQSQLPNIIGSSILLTIINAIILILNWILGYGIISNILDLVNIKTNSITDFINDTLKNFIKYIRIGLKILLKILIPLIVFILSAFYWIGTIIAKINNVNFLCFYQNLVPLSTVLFIITGIILIYFIFKYILVAYIYYENPNMPENEIINKSKTLMKGNIINYILLILSFLHWFLIGALILLILNIFIEQKYLTPFIVIFYSIFKPYIIVSKSEFYKELSIDKETK